MKRFEADLAEKQRHMDWYAKECQSIDIDTPQEIEEYQKRYYALIRDRTDVQQKYARFIRKHIARLKQATNADNSQVRQERNQLKKRYFQLQARVDEARAALQQIDPAMMST